MVSSVSNVAFSLRTGLLPSVSKAWVTIAFLRAGISTSSRPSSSSRVRATLMAVVPTRVLPSHALNTVVSSGKYRRMLRSNEEYAFAYAGTMSWKCFSPTDSSAKTSRPFASTILAMLTPIGFSVLCTDTTSLHWVGFGALAPPTFARRRVLDTDVGVGRWCRLSRVACAGRAAASMRLQCALSAACARPVRPGAHRRRRSGGTPHNKEGAAGRPQAVTPRASLCGHWPLPDCALRLRSWHRRCASRARPPHMGRGNDGGNDVADEISGSGPRPSARAAGAASRRIAALGLAGRSVRGHGLCLASAGRARSASRLDGRPLREAQPAASGHARCVRRAPRHGGQCHRIPARAGALPPHAPHGRPAAQRRGAAPPHSAGGRP